MLSVLPTSWQQQHGPGRRRRCGNGAARVAEPVFAPARRPREALLASRSALRPSPGRERVTGAGRPRARPPAAGRLRSSSGPARAVLGAAGRGGRLGRTPRAGPGKRRRGAEPRLPCSPDVWQLFLQHWPLVFTAFTRSELLQKLESLI